MKLLKLELYNFGSYDKLEYDFSHSNLALISGPTGSGKSTLQNAPMWVLFGRTSKDGNADEVRSWFSDGMTEGTLTLLLNDTKIEVCRKRASQSSHNDLYWLEDGSYEAHRGKDTKETQTLLESRLNVSYETYRIAASYNEFSPTSNFFVDSAAKRRELFESLADLSFATNLVDSIKTSQSNLKPVIQDLDRELARLGGKYEEVKSAYVRRTHEKDEWDRKQAALIDKLKLQSANFQKEIDQKKSKEILKLAVFKNRIEDDKDKLVKRIFSFQAKIEAADTDKCPTCGNTKEPIASWKEQVAIAENQLAGILDSPMPEPEEVSSENYYLESIETERNKLNPFLENDESKLIKLGVKIKTLTLEFQQLTRKQEGYKQLIKLTSIFRTQLLRRAIDRTETNVNKYLEKFFDSEIKVEFDLSDTEVLSVKLWKNGYDCVFTQLSKGQRALLKLCFSISIMEQAANEKGVLFDSIFFDEALDGMDNDMKVKAYGLFSELSLSHNNVMVIDHSPELQNLFDTQYKVSLVNDRSVVEKV